MIINNCKIRLGVIVTNLDTLHLLLQVLVLPSFDKQDAYQENAAWPLPMECGLKLSGGLDPPMYIEEGDMNCPDMEDI